MCAGSVATDKTCRNTNIGKKYMDNNFNGAKNFHTSSERDLKSGEAGKGLAFETPSSSNMQMAVYEFIAAFTSVDRNNIIKGWQNTSILSPQTESYAVFTSINAKRRGTNIENYIPDNNTLTLEKSNIIDYQIDIVATDADTARNNISALETVARSAAGVNFFNNYNINLLYAEDAKAIETISKTDNYVNRYMITLHLEEINAVTVSQDYFDNVEVKTVLADGKV